MLAADLDGGNSMIFAKGENAIKSRLFCKGMVYYEYKNTSVGK